MSDNAGAYEFLGGLSKHLNERLPGPDTIRAEVNKRWNKPPAERDSADKLACKENLFLYHFALPLIFAYVKNSAGMDHINWKLQAGVRGETANGY